MATAKKLPSGRYRVRIYDYTDSAGDKHYKSFTAETKQAAEQLALDYQARKNSIKKTEYLTLSDAWDMYIGSRSNVLSPSTLRIYRNLKDVAFLELMPTNIYEITQEDIQKSINAMARDFSPKTVRNRHGMLSAILGAYRPDFSLNTALPQKVKPNLYIPTDDDVKRLMDIARENDDMYIAILLAAFGPMRRSEICALNSSDITGNIVHVNKAKVMSSDYKWVIKTTKTVAGDRYIEFPEFVIAELNRKDGQIVKSNPNNISDRFRTLLKKAELPHFRFHDLRHYSASIQHAIGIPDAYIMERGGWGSDRALKNIYRHTMEQKTLEINRKINDYFTNL